MNKEKRPAVFLDRDGTINLDKGYICRPEEWEFEAGSVEAIRLLNQAGYLVIVISNQAGIGMGHFAEAQVEKLHAWVLAELIKQGAQIDGFYFCPHHPEHGLGAYKTVCRCRKPAPGLIIQAAAEQNIDLARSYMIGDHNSDVEAGRAADVQPIFVRTGHGDHEEVKVAPDIPRAANLYEAVTTYILG